MGPLATYEAALGYDGRFLWYTDGRAAWLNWLEVEIAPNGNVIDPNGNDNPDTQGDLAALLHYALPALTLDIPVAGVVASIFVEPQSLKDETPRGALDDGDTRGVDPIT